MAWTVVTRVRRRGGDRGDLTGQAGRDVGAARRHGRRDPADGLLQRGGVVADLAGPDGQLGARRARGRCGRARGHRRAGRGRARLAVPAEEPHAARRRMDATEPSDTAIGFSIPSPATFRLDRVEPRGMGPRSAGRRRLRPGSMPPGEGLALHEAGLAGAAVGPLLEIGSYCGKSAVYLGTAARSAGTVSSRPSTTTTAPRRTRPGGAPRSGGRRPAHRSHGHAAVPRCTIEDAGLESSPSRRRRLADGGRHWATSVGLLFIDGGHALDVAMADYATWPGSCGRRAAGDPRRLRVRPTAGRRRS